MYDLPQDILRIIYEYDDTYRIKYTECVNELLFVVQYNHIIDNMNIINHYYNHYKDYCTRNNERFNSEIYNPIMTIKKYYRQFSQYHSMKNALLHRNIKGGGRLTKIKKN
jgi:hypothetical protein